MEFQKDLDALLAPLSYLQNAEGGDDGSDNRELSDGTAKEAFLKLMQTLCDLTTETKFMQLLEETSEDAEIDHMLELADKEYRSALNTMDAGNPSLAAEEVRLAREIAQVQEQIQAEQRLAEISEEEARRLEQRIAEFNASKQSVAVAVGTTQDLSADDLQAERDLKFLRDVRSVVETALGVSVQSVEDDMFALGIGRFTVSVKYERDTSKVVDLRITPKPPASVAEQAEKTSYLNDIPDFVLFIKRNTN